MSRDRRVIDLNYLLNNSNNVDTSNLVSKDDIVDNLTTEDSEKVLSAKQGTVLLNLINSIKKGILTMDFVVKAFKKNFINKFTYGNPSNDGSNIFMYSNSLWYHSSDNSNTVWKSVSGYNSSYPYLLGGIFTTDTTIVLAMFNSNEDKVYITEIDAYTLEKTGNIEIEIDVDVSNIQRNASYFTWIPNSDKYVIIGYNLIIILNNDFTLNKRITFSNTYCIPFPMRENIYLMIYSDNSGAEYGYILNTDTGNEIRLIDNLWSNIGFNNIFGMAYKHKDIFSFSTYGAQIPVNVTDFIEYYKDKAFKQEGVTLW